MIVFLYYRHSLLLCSSFTNPGPLGEFMLGVMFCECMKWEAKKRESLRETLKVAVIHQVRTCLSISLFQLSREIQGNYTKYLEQCRIFTLW